MRWRWWPRTRLSIGDPPPLPMSLGAKKGPGSRCCCHRHQYRHAQSVRGGPCGGAHIATQLPPTAALPDERVVLCSRSSFTLNPIGRHRWARLGRESARLC